MNLNELFSGSALSAKANAVKAVKAMLDGIASILSAEVYTSKSNGSLCAKISFQDMSAPNDPMRGHDEIISTREGARFVRLLEKVKYIFKSTNRMDLLEALPSPFGPVIENGQPVQFDNITTNEQMREIQEKHGSEVTFFWLSDVQPFQAPQGVTDKEQLASLQKEYNKQRVVVAWNDRAGYIDALVNAINELKGQNVKLKFADNKDNDFRSLKKILPASIS